MVGRELLDVRGILLERLQERARIGGKIVRRRNFRLENLSFGLEEPGRINPLRDAAAFRAVHKRLDGTIRQAQQLINFAAHGDVPEIFGSRRVDALVALRQKDHPPGMNAHGGFGGQNRQRTAHEDRRHRVRNDHHVAQRDNGQGPDHRRILCGKG